jgi:hypothetical protein
VAGREGCYLDLIGVDFHTMSQSFLHVLRVKVAQSESTHSLVFGQILEGVEIMRILVLRHDRLLDSCVR